MLVYVQPEGRGEDDFLSLEQVDCDGASLISLLVNDGVL